MNKKGHEAKPDDEVSLEFVALFFHTTELSAR